MEESKSLETTRQDKERQDSQEAKTFTQEEVDEIVKKRLARERRRADTFEQEQTEIDKTRDLRERELKIMAKEKLLDAGMPTMLADILRYDDDESLEKAIETIKNLDLSKERGVPKGWGQRHSTSTRNADAIRKAMGLDRKGV